MHVCRHFCRNSQRRSFFFVGGCAYSRPLRESSSVATANIFSSVNKTIPTLLDEYFISNCFECLSTVVQGWRVNRRRNCAVRLTSALVVGWYQNAPSRRRRHRHGRPFYRNASKLVTYLTSDQCVWRAGCQLPMMNYVNQRHIPDSR